MSDVHTNLTGKSGRPASGIRTRLHKLSARLNLLTLIALLLVPVASEAARKTLSNKVRKADKLAVIAIPPLPTPRPAFATEQAKTTITTSAKSKPTTTAPQSADARTAAIKPAVSKTLTEWPKEMVSQARENCVAVLAKLKVDYEWMPPVRKNRCGDPAPIRLKSIGSISKVKIYPPASVNCSMAAALNRWMDTKMQPLARKHLGSSIAGLSNIASYSCRNRYGRKNARLSEHALANALDIAGFTLADGRKVDLLSHWGKTRRAIAAEQTRRELEQQKEKARKAKAAIAARATGKKSAQAQTTEAAPSEAVLQNAVVKLPRKVKRPRQVAKRRAPQQNTQADGPKILKPRPPRARFLREAFNAACDVFGTVLGPEANKAHENHFHVDLAPRRRKAYCE